MRKVLPLVLLLASAAACSQPQVRWQKAGADDKATAEDLMTCRNAAANEAMRDLPLEVPTWLPPYWAGPYTPVQPDNRRFLTENRLTAFCMRNKGYELVAVPPAPKPTAPETPPAPAPAPQK